MESRKLHWRKPPPDRPGWYWVRGVNDSTERIVEAEGDGGTCYVHSMGPASELKDYWQWAGPIPRPLKLK